MTAGTTARIRTTALIRFVLRLTEPGGVTVPAPARRDDIDLALDRDPHGRPHLPGTTIAGGLRDLVRTYSGTATADALFGWLTPKNEYSDDVDAVASDIWVLGSCLVIDDGAKRPPAPVTRTATAIDRRRGAARTHALYTDELLPAGSRFEVYLRWDNPDTDQLTTFLAHLAGWRPLVGRGVSRGRGRAVTDETTYGVLNLTDPADALRWLTLDGPDLIRQVAVQPPPVHVTGPAPVAPLLLDVPVRIAGPLRFGDGTTALDDSGREVAQLFQIDGRYVIPGSGLKGLLRSRCEYILRSITADPEPCLDQRCGQCWPCRIFGFGGGHDRITTTVGRRARLRIPDADITNPVPVQRTHVAIDRFTAGALDEHLYTVEALEGGTFHLRIEALDLPPADEPMVRALLRLVLADLADGLIGIGAGTARGYGTVQPDLQAVQATGQLTTLAQARATLAGTIRTSAGDRP